ncbi:helix-turn-helix domain-containing protein [Tsukamurella pseudospumae]|uniref:helix-turn-helix domain-containing protein n=1 Tax=Tsukamurella pseudospumae TaxID=239498 RepID=UPI003CC7CC40
MLGAPGRISTCWSATLRTPALSWQTPTPLRPPVVAGIPAQAVSVSVAAAMLGVSEKTIRRNIDTGALPARKLPSGSLSIRVSDLDQLGELVGPRTGPRRSAPSTPRPARRSASRAASKAATA